MAPNVFYEITLYNLPLISPKKYFPTIQDLTEFNTAHNRRLATLPMDENTPTNELSRKRRRSGSGVTFAEGEIIINPGKYSYLIKSVYSHDFSWLIVRFM